MKDPQGYFSNPVERELAAEAWKVGGCPAVDPFFMWYPPHESLKSAVETEFQKRVITARNWITGMRDQQEAWGETGIDRVKSYYKNLYKRDIQVNNTHIANVEHFFTSAAITVISGSFYALTTAGTVWYEVCLQPIGVALKNLSLKAGWDNFVNGWGQLAGPDRQGVVFVLMNSNYSALDVQQFLGTDADVVDPVPLPTSKKPEPSGPPGGVAPSGKTRTVKAGESLSLIAKDAYKSVELWPLLWDQNRVAVPNPNRVKVGQVLNCKDLSEFTTAQITDAKRRSPTWKNYPHP